MPNWRVQTEDVTPRLAPAAAPVYRPTEASTTNGLMRFAGAPGTQEIPSPRPRFASPRAMQGQVHAPQDLRPSDVSPDVFLPRLGVPFADHCVPLTPRAGGVNNEIPIPAGNYVRLPKLASKSPPRLGGQGVIPWPRTFTRWPSAVASVPTDG